jgi:hypothetical protein
MFYEMRLDDMRPQVLDPGQRAALVFAEPLAVADNIGGNDCRQFATQCHSPSEMNSTNLNSKFEVAYYARGCIPSADAVGDTRPTPRSHRRATARKFPYLV